MKQLNRILFLLLLFNFLSCQEDIYSDSTIPIESEIENNYEQIKVDPRDYPSILAYIEKNHPNGEIVFSDDNIALRTCTIYKIDKSKATLIEDERGNKALSFYVDDDKSKSLVNYVVHEWKDGFQYSKILEFDFDQTYLKENIHLDKLSLYKNRTGVFKTYRKDGFLLLEEKYINGVSTSSSITEPDCIGPEIECPEPNSGGGNSPPSNDPPSDPPGGLPPPPPPPPNDNSGGDNSGDDNDSDSGDGCTYQYWPMGDGICEKYLLCKDKPRVYLGTIQCPPGVGYEGGTSEGTDPYYDEENWPDNTDDEEDGNGNDNRLGVNMFVFCECAPICEDQDGNEYYCDELPDPTEDTDFAEDAYFDCTYDLENDGDCWSYCYEGNDFCSEEDNARNFINNRLDLDANMTSWVNNDASNDQLSALKDFLLSNGNSIGVNETGELYIECIDSEGQNCCNIIDTCHINFDENMESTVDCFKCDRIPCLDDIISNIETNNGDVFEIMQLFAGTNGEEPNMDLKIKVKNNVPGGNFARTIIRGGSSNRPTVIIELSKSLLENSSQLYIHSVIIHEFIHAYIYYRLRNNISLFENESQPLYEIVDNFGQMIPIETHLLIANQYVPNLLNELKSSYSDIDFPFNENEYLEHIVWSGLIDFLEDSNPNTDSGQQALQIWRNRYPEGSTFEQDFYYAYLNEGNFNSQGQNFEDYGPECN